MYIGIKVKARGRSILGVLLCPRSIVGVRVGVGMFWITLCPPRLALSFLSGWHVVVGWPASNILTAFAVVDSELNKVVMSAVLCLKTQH